MNEASKNTITLGGVAFAFLLLAAAFLLNVWGRPGSRPPMVLVDPQFTNTATVRMSAAEVVSTGGDASGQDCYACHERGKEPKLTFNPDLSIVNAKEHMDITMGHGGHNRNNNCYNCHDESNLEALQTRDGRELKLVDSTPLCGSCHGPTYRDWEAGIHGRTSGYWKRDAGTIRREACVSCHDPHQPRFPARQPAPAPNPLRPSGARPPDALHAAPPLL